MLAQDTYDRDLATRHWWWKARGRLLDMLLDRYLPNGGDVLDVGCGVGQYSAFERINGRYVGIDHSLGALSLCSSSVAGVAADAYSLPFKDSSFDLGLSLDVLEHLEFPEKAMQEIKRVSRHVILSVPAMPSLWSDHDVRLGHYKRYTQRELEHLMISSGFEILECRYFMGVTFPAAWMHRKLTNALGKPSSNGTPEGFELPKWINRGLEFFCSLETRAPLPFGSSLFAVGRRW